MGSTQSIMVTAAGLFGSSDPRTPRRAHARLLTAGRSAGGCPGAGACSRHGVPETTMARAQAHRVAAEGITREQAVDEAILRINQILSE